MEIEGAGGDAEYKKLEAVVNMFAGYNDNLAKEGELKDAIRKVTKEIDGKCREMKTILGQIHSGRTDGTPILLGTHQLLSQGCINAMRCLFVHLLHLLLQSLGGGGTPVAAVCARARAFVPGLKANFAELKEVAQKNKHYYQYATLRCAPPCALCATSNSQRLALRDGLPLPRYREFWKNAQSTIVFLVGLVQFLEDGRLVSLREVEEMLDRTRASPYSAQRTPLSLCWQSAGRG